ncbi:hypothetical protein MRS44_013790 [Fusarium solani]|uniref:uncharacterized protein n=1 Tax=Fusarium solani TaxID=169388 RepID=UPI0032C43098|nr:hypothetical protein MRS44_013790 [Fusarium solani]
MIADLTSYQSLAGKQKGKLGDETSRPAECQRHPFAGGSGVCLFIALCRNLSAFQLRPSNEMKERAAAAAFGGGSESAMLVAAPGLGEAGKPLRNVTFLQPTISTLLGQIIWSKHSAANQGKTTQVTKCSERIETDKDFTTERTSPPLGRYDLVEQHIECSANRVLHSPSSFSNVRTNMLRTHSNAIATGPYRCCPLRAARKRQYVTACVEKELDQQRLISMQALALDCGSAHVAAPRSLHHQTLRSGEILVKERLNMHLVWSDVPQADAPIPPRAEFNGEQMGVFFASFELVIGMVPKSLLWTRQQRGIGIREVGGEEVG